MAVTDQGFEEELRLAKRMKEFYCDVLGKETNPAKAAEIIHRIGSIYRKRSPDKISLIKSAGLLNAAIIRNPTNVDEVKSDLNELCQHVLQQADANKRNVDLIQKAEEVKTSINNLREDVSRFLEKFLPKIQTNDVTKSFQKLILKKILAIKKINKIIAANYKDIMAEISQFCEGVMGTPPCSYAIVGLGSLAREEITPYSDFEHIILLFDDENYESHLSYFRWFSVIFHIIVLNLQETIIPSLNVSSLNNENDKQGNWYYDAITPRGISFDGMMPHASKNPLGRTQPTKNKQFTIELIKPVSKMLEYLSSDADLKNGYHLADILTKTCFVFGNENIFKQFVDEARKYQNQKSQTDIINDVQQQVKDDLNSFSTRFRLSNLRSQNTINIKQLVYRSTTIFIAALARLHNISGNSCFDVIDQMKKNNKITKKAAHRLQRATAIACEIRLRVYMKKQQQFDNAIDLKEDNAIDKFLDIVGVECTINYFQIAYCLQYEVAKHINLAKIHFYSNPHLINITICLALGARNLISYLCKTNQHHWNPKKSNLEFDQIIDQVEEKIDLNSIVFNSITFKSPDHFDPNKVKEIANYLRLAGIYNDAAEFYKKYLDLIQELKDSDHNYDFASLNYNLGLCLINSDQPKEALTYLNQSLLVFSAKKFTPDKDGIIAKIHYFIGCSHIQLCNYNHALTHLNQALDINHSLTPNAEEDKDIAETLYKIGCCHLQLHNYEDALTFLNQELKIKQNLALDAEKNKDIATTLHVIGHCYIHLHNYNDALTLLNKALKIKLNSNFYAKQDMDVSVTLHEIGHCHIGLHNYDEALENLYHALEIEQNSELETIKDKNIVVTLHELGRCHIYMYNYDDALVYLNQALFIKQNATLNPEKDKSIALTLDCIGHCYIDLHLYEYALKRLNRALQIKQNATLDINTDRDLAITQYQIGRGLTGMQRFDESYAYLDNSLKILRNTSIEKRSDVRLAIAFSYMGEYFIGKQDFTKAVTNLQQAIDIYQILNTSTSKDTRFARAFHNIALCLIKLQKFAIALNYLKQSLEIYESVSCTDYVWHKLNLIRLNVDECLTKLN